MPAGHLIHTSLVISLSAAMLTACVASQPADDRTVAANAAAAREAAPERPIDISRLRGRIVFSAGPSQKKEEIYVVNADGSGLQQVTDNFHWDFDPSWSPDGDRIVFRSQRHGNDEIHAIDVNGTEERNISRAPGADWGPDWSPDGTVIAFNSDRTSPGEFHTLYVMNADGTGQTRVTDEPYAQFATWSPDGKYIMFTPALLRRLRRQRRIARRRPPLARGNRAGSGPGLRRPRCLTSAPISSSNWPTCCELPISSAPRGKPSMKLPGCMKERGTSLPLGA
jgi:dipeptidyl aminopeptidase/acylaminoacyl peptidase